MFRHEESPQAKWKVFGEIPKGFRQEEDPKNSGNSDRGRVAEKSRAGENGPKADGDLFPIVGIGASAGGLEAFTRLVQQLPSDTGLAFVLVQHLDPEHESKLPQLLGRVTNLPVLEIINNIFFINAIQW